jgi:hypothetical protein
MTQIVHTWLPKLYSARSTNIPVLLHTVSLCCPQRAHESVQDVLCSVMEELCTLTESGRNEYISLEEAHAVTTQVLSRDALCSTFDNSPTNQGTRMYLFHKLMTLSLLSSGLAEGFESFIS